ncbi:MAG: FG-GAP-like repeat-containing protein [Vicinamibacterales bacterium]
MRFPLCRSIAGALALIASLGVSAATVTSVTIEGPDTIDLQNSTSVQYRAIAHWSDATTTDVTQAAYWGIATGNILSVVAGGVVIASGVGTQTISATFLPSEGGVFSPTKSVSVMAGTAPIWQAVSPACALEDTNGFPAQQLQRIFLGPMSDAVPVCGAKIVMGNRSVNRLQVIDLRTRTVVGSAPLSSEPRRIRTVPGTTTLLVAVGASQVARIDLTTGATAYASVSGTIRDIAPGEPGEAMILHSPSSSSYFDTWVAVLDLATMTILADRKLSADGGLIDYDPTRNHLFLGVAGLSPSSLSRLVYEPASSSFTLDQYRYDAGSDGMDLTLSPDGSRLAFTGGWGNGRDYAIHDLTASDIESRLGRWSVGPYPRAVGFRHDGLKVIATSNDRLIEFDAGRHVVERSWPMDSSDDPVCFYAGAGPQRARYSPSGRFAFATYPCDSAGYYSVVDVVALGDPTPPSSPPAVPATDLAFACSAENKGALPAQAPVRLPVEPVSDIVPACHGRVVLAASESNRVVTLDARTGTELGSVPLSASPQRLSRLSGSAIHFAKLDAMRVARVDPVAGTAINLEIEGEVSGIVEGAPGQVFVVFRVPGSLDPGDQVAVLDAASGARLGTGQLSARGGLLQYDPVARRLLQGDEDRAPANLVRYLYEPATFSFTEQQRSTNFLGGGLDLDLSADRTRAVFVTSNGNITSLPNRLYDLSAADFSTNFGVWNVGAYPASADFRQDGAKLLASNGTELQVLDGTSHALDRAWPLPPGGCSGEAVKRIRYSPGGKIAFALSSCFAFPYPTSSLIALALDAPVNVAQNDFNADGKPDILWQNIASGETYIWHMDGPVPVSGAALPTAGPSWKVQAIADFNGDGHVDLVLRNASTGAFVLWYLANGAYQSSAVLFTLPLEWVIQGAADFNADGKPDLLMRNTSSGLAFAWFLDNGTPVGSQVLFTISPAWKVEGVGDFNADGQPDLLFRDTASGVGFAWYTQYSAGALGLGSSSPAMYLIDPVWEVAQVADWNGDGKPDLLFRSATAGVVFVWYLDGTTLLGTDIVTQVDPAWEIVPRR